MSGPLAVFHEIHGPGESTGNTDRLSFFLIKSTKVLRGKESSETTDDEGSKRSSCVCCNEMFPPQHTHVGTVCVRGAAAE